MGNQHVGVVCALTLMSLQGQGTGPQDEHLGAAASPLRASLPFHLSPSFLASSL